jgi:hypothetical protein
LTPHRSIHRIGKRPRTNRKHADRNHFEVASRVSSRWGLSPSDADQDRRVGANHRPRRANRRAATTRRVSERRLFPPHPSNPTRQRGTAVSRSVGPLNAMGQFASNVQDHWHDPLRASNLETPPSHERKTNPRLPTLFRVIRVFRGFKSQFPKFFVLVLRVSSTRTRTRRNAIEYVYHFIEYDYARSGDSATS